MPPSGCQTHLERVVVIVYDAAARWVVIGRDASRRHRVKRVDDDLLRAFDLRPTERAALTVRVLVVKTHGYS